MARHFVWETFGTALVSEAGLKQVQPQVVFFNDRKDKNGRPHPSKASASAALGAMALALSRPALAAAMACGADAQADGLVLFFSVLRPEKDQSCLAQEEKRALAVCIFAFLPARKWMARIAPPLSAVQQVLSEEEQACAAANEA